MGVDTQSEMWRGVVLLCAVITLAGAAASEYDNRNQIKSGINTPVDQRRRGDERELDARWSHEESRVTRQNSHPIVYLLSTLLRLLSLLDGAEYDDYGNNKNRHRRKRLNLTEETIVYPVLFNKIKKYNMGR